MLLPEHNLCICTAFAERNSIHSLYLATRERKSNALPSSSSNSSFSLNTATEQLLLEVSSGKRDYSYMLGSGTSVGQQLNELAGHHGRLWKPGRVLRIKFLEGDPYVHERVMHYARIWEQYANIKFDFVIKGDAEVRIAFRAIEGSRSMLGTDALDNTDALSPTMNFGWFNRNTSEEEFRATTLHEFGHCLGCIHEHQSPDASLRWNKPLIYQWMYRSYGWEQAKVDHNMFAEFERSAIRHSAYDPLSIMHYYYPPEFTLDGTILTRNTELSVHDKEMIGQLYPADASSRLLKG